MITHKQKWITAAVIILFVPVLGIVYTASPSSGSSALTNQDSTKNYKSDPLSVELNNRAMTLWQNELLKDRPDSYTLALVIELLDSAITIDSSNYIPYTNKSNVLCNMGHKQEAVAVMEKCIKNKPGFAEGINFLGMLYEALGKKKEAMRNYENALAVFEKRYREKHSFNDRGNGIIVLLQLGRKKEADSLAGRLRYEFPERQKEIADFLTTYTSYNHDEMITGICGSKYK